MLMSARRLPLLPVLAFAVVCTTACDIVTADLKHSAEADWRKTYTLDEGGRVEVVNVNGRISVEPSGGRAVEIVAEKKGKGVSEEAARQAVERIEISETVSGSSIRVETRTPRSSGMFGGSTEVTYLVKVPAGADVKFTTVNGGIELSRLTGRIRAETTNGGIKATDVSGTIDASTTNGGVDVDLTKVDQGGVSLGCTNGGIKLRLPAESAATIAADVTNGGINADGLELDKTESTRRTLRARLNGGGPAIKIEGTNGGITIAAR